MRNELFTTFTSIALLTQLGSSCVPNNSTPSDIDYRGIPNNAELVAQGTGDISFPAVEDGTVYAYDASSQTLLFNSRIHRGERCGLHPYYANAEINGGRVYSGEMARDDRYELYLYRDSRKPQTSNSASGGSSGNHTSHNQPEAHGTTVDPRIPDTATKVAEGKNALSYRAADDGRLYLYDYENKHVAYERSVSKGQRISVDTTRSRVTLDGKDVQADRLYEQNNYRLYFNVNK